MTRQDGADEDCDNVIFKFDTKFILQQCTISMKYLNSRFSLCDHTTTGEIDQHNLKTICIYIFGFVAKCMNLDPT